LDKIPKIRNKTCDNTIINIIIIIDNNNNNSFYS